MSAETATSNVVYQGKIPARVKYSFAFGALGKDMIYGMIATFSMIYFTDIIVARMPQLISPPSKAGPAEQAQLTIKSEFPKIGRASCRERV